MTGRTQRAGGRARTALRANFPLLAIIAVQLAFLAYLRLQVGELIEIDPLEFAGFLTASVARASAVALVLVLAWALVRHPLRLRGLIGSMRNRHWREIVLARLPVAGLFLIATQVLYVSAKVNYTTAFPFAWDETFAAWDRALTGGIDPWRLTHAVLPGARLTQVMDGIYLLWFMVIYASAAFIALRPFHDRLRLGYLTAFGLAWLVGGTFMASWFSSAGPVYLERLTGNPAFRPLMELLAAQDATYPMYTLRGQEFLWRGYAERIGVGGVSAFPSMHVMMAILAARLGFEWSRLAGWMLSLFAAAIFVGSVHLGWHYAVDGIAALAVAALCWKAGMTIAERWLRFAAIAAPARTVAGTGD